MKFLILKQIKKIAKVLKEILTFIREMDYGQEVTKFEINRASDRLAVARTQLIEAIERNKNVSSNRTTSE